MSQRTPHSDDLTALKETCLPRHIQHLVNSAKGQRPDDLIRQVRDGALLQYHRTKREKQRELSPRVDVARQNGDRAAFKNAKKKVDNHASSVASRARRAFLIASYEKAVQNSMAEKNQLADVILAEHTASTKKDAELRRLQLRLDKLTKENESLKSHISRSQSHMDQFNDLDRDTMELRELDEEARFLNPASDTTAVASAAVEVTLKMSEWEPPLTAVTEDLQAQMKVDNPTGVLFRAV